MRRWWLPVAGLLFAAAAALLVLSTDPEGIEGRLFFGLWRTRYIALAAGISGLGSAAICAAVSDRALLRFAFVTLQVGAVVLALELVGWTGLVSYPHMLGNVRDLPTNALAVSPVPNLDVCGKTYQDTAQSWGLPQDPIPFCYRTNRYGFRNPPDLDDADVYLLGDSIVVSALVPYEETIAARLSREWGRPVMNVALIAVSPQEEQQVFRDAGLPVEGRLVLQFVFEGNDLLDSAQFASDQGPPPWDPVRDGFTRSVVLALQRLTQPTVAQAARFSCHIDGRQYVFRWGAGAWEGLDADYDRIFTSMEDFAREIRDRGGEYAVVFVPSKLRVLGPACDAWPAKSELRPIVDANPFRARARAWSAASGIPVVDLTDALRASALAGRIPWHWGDTHWNTTAQERAASVIADAARAGILKVPAR